MFPRSLLFFALLLGVLVHPSSVRAQDSLYDISGSDMSGPDATGTIVQDGYTLTMGAGVAYLKPQDFDGANVIIRNAGGVFQDRPKSAFTDGFPGLHLYLAAEAETGLEFRGLDDIRLVARLNYSGGSDTDTYFQDVPAGYALAAMSIDPEWYWLGTVGGVAGVSLRNTVSVDVDNIDLSLGIDARSDPWLLSGGRTLTPVYNAGLFVSSQWYNASSRQEQSGVDGEYSLLDENLRTWDMGPEFGVGLELETPDGLAFSVRGEGALLLGLAHLSADQQLETSVLTSNTNRSPSFHVQQSRNDLFLSMLFRLALGAEQPISEALTAGLDFTASYWTARPTIDNPYRLDNGAGLLSAPGHNSGVTIGYGEAYEINAAFTLGYSF